MIEIYHAPMTRGIRAIWACEELQLDYRVVAVDFSPTYRATPEWRAMNPVGKVPVLVDGELKMFESGAMVQYLIDRYGSRQGIPPLQPEPGTPEHALYLQWCWFAEATFARPLGEIVNHRRALSVDAQSEEAIAEMQNRAWLCITALEQALAGQKWILGSSFSAADIMLGYTLMLMETLAPGDMPEAVAGYWSAIQSRAGYQRAASARAEIA